MKQHRNTTILVSGAKLSTQHQMWSTHMHGGFEIQHITVHFNLLVKKVFMLQFSEYEMNNISIKAI